jgi:hypothetical protein
MIIETTVDCKDADTDDDCCHFLAVMMMMMVAVTSGVHCHVSV